MLYQRREEAGNPLPQGYILVTSDGVTALQFADRVDEDALFEEYQAVFEEYASYFANDVCAHYALLCKGNYVSDLYYAHTNGYTDGKSDQGTISMNMSYEEIVEQLTNSASGN